MKTRRFSLSIVAAFFTVSSLNLAPSANAIMDGQVVQNDSRVVPIFLLQNENDPQPTTRVAYTGFLYSSRIVFTSIPDFGFDGQGNKTTNNFAAIYVGKPGSDISETTGRVKVIKRFLSKQFRFESSQLDDFAILVLEKDLISANPYRLLSQDMERDLVKVAKVTGYGEYRDHCPPGRQPPCREQLFEPSSKPRTVNVNIVSLTEIESIVGYQQPQLRNQLILYNRSNPRQGAVCFGDSGAPITGEYQLKRVYLGQMSSAVRIYGCGRGVGYDGKGGIHYASPVYRHLQLIREAEAFVQALKKDATKSEEVSTSIIASGNTTVSLKTTKSFDHENEKVTVTYVGELSDPKSKPTGFRFFNGYGADLRQIRQIPLESAKCTTPSKNTLRCSFPNFNPYKNILIKKSGVALQVAPYNNAGQGPLSLPVTMHEILWKSLYKEIDFVDNAKVINDIFSSSFGFNSRVTTSQLRGTFILEGPPLPKNFKYKLELKEKNSSKSVTHEAELKSHRYQSGRNEVKIVSKERLKFPGDSEFNLNLQIFDQDEFIRANETKIFSFGYNMDWRCSTSVFAGLTIKDGAKLNLKTLITGSQIFNSTKDLVEDLIFPGKAKPPSILDILTSPAFVAEVGLNLIEAVEEEDHVKFVIETGMQVNTILAEKLAFGVIDQSMSPEAGLAINHVYTIILNTKESIDILLNYYKQIDVWAKNNSETVVDLCGKR